MLFFNVATTPGLICNQCGTEQEALVEFNNGDTACMVCLADATLGVYQELCEYEKIMKEKDSE